MWRIIKEEIDAGWLRGPFSEEMLKKLLGPLFVVSQRFGIVQGPKVRQIDDLSASLINAAFCASEKMDHGGIDELAALAKFLVESVHDDGKVVMKLSSGQVLSGRLRHPLSVLEARSLVGQRWI